MTVPLHIPKGLTHAQYVLSEAEQAYKDGRHSDAIVNVCHAIYVVARDGMDPDEARNWFGRITTAAGAWDLDR